MPRPALAAARRYTRPAMDGECAFCGRADGGSQPVFCEDCQSQHRVCGRCADDAAHEAATLGLRLLP